MKKASAEPPDLISHTLSANDANAIAPSAIGSAMRLPRVNRRSPHINSGSTR
jgi:hypothetical protein